MSFSLKDIFHTSFAESVYNDILSRRSNYYYFIGRILPWADEGAPPVVSIASDYEHETRNNILAVKKLQLTDVSFVVPRRDWTSGIVYDQYDGNYSPSNPAQSGATSTKSSSFYVLTDDFNVYKCLFNYNNSASTIKPTGTEAVPITTADNYVWKYLYTIPLSLRNRFLTNDWMPVQKSVLNPFYSNGEISTVVIDNVGSGYYTNNTSISLIGDGSGANLVPYVNASGEVEDIIIVNGGEGYTYVDITVVGQGSGANAYGFLSTGDLDTVQSTVELSAVDGSIYAFKVNNPGNNYSHANVVVYGDGTDFVGSVVLNNANGVSYITVTTPGSGYTYANVVITGDGSNANVSAILSPYGGHGKNPIKELYADTLMFYSTINNEKIHNIDVNNDYRQFGLIKDLKQYANSKTFANVTGTSCFLINANTTINALSNQLERDTTLTLVNDSTKLFNVVEVSANNRILISNLNNADLVAGNVLYDSNTDSSFSIETIDNYPTINKFSGDLLFIDNRTTVSYSDQQLVTLRTVIKL